LIRNIAE